MRIFYAADHEPFPGNHLWHTNLYLPLVDLGHEVIPFAYDLTPHILHADLGNPAHQAFIAEHRPTLETALLTQISAEHARRPIDLFFSYFYSALCRPEVIREIHRLGIATMNWYCNASYQFHLIEELAPAYDYCLVPEKFRLDDYRRVGAHPLYCQEAANPTVYRHFDLPYDYAVTFIGQRYGDRPTLIDAILRQDIPVQVWGNGWQTAPSRPRGWWRRLKARFRSPAPDPYAPYCGPPLSDEELVRTFSRSKINLGFSSCGETHREMERILQVRLRDFEVPMSGGFYLVEYMPELEEFFDIGREVVCYHSAEELVDMVRYYLMHDAEREQIRVAGYTRARRDHSWQARFRQVFTQIRLGE